MNFLSVFENRVSGIFGATRAPFSFKKLAKQAANEMEDQTLVINGVNTAPALYTVLIANEDDPLMAPFYPQLSREVSELVKAQANKKRYTFVGEPLVRFMIDPSLKSGRFSVFAENVDAPTLGRLYEEERAYQKGLAAGAPAPAPAEQREKPAPAWAALAGDAHPSAAPGDPFAADPFGPGAGEVPAPVPQTMLREQMPGMGGAAATGAAAASSIAQNMANARTPQQPAAPLAEIVDVVTGESVRIDQARVTVGRERAAADVVLRDPNVSRRHAELTYTGSGWSIEDLNSTNGTLVNNRRITRCPLRNGDLLTFGLSTFEFRG
ncbi:MAG: FhaA domain-containing protein [Collinsella sp.]|nr:FhaA domain-containing protein [Collinsella sp.]